MKSTTLNWIATAACFAGLAVPAQVSAQNRPRYMVKDLGKCASGYGISNNGEVAGTSDQCGAPATAFLWKHGQFHNLGTLGGVNSGASVVNAKGEVALSSETSKIDPYDENFCRTGTGQQCAAAVWKDGALKQLNLIAADRNSQAYGINERGEIVGFAETEKKNPRCNDGTTSSHQVFWFQPVVWATSGEILKRLDPLPGDEVAFAWGINNRGQAVGGSGSCATTVLPPPVPFAEHGVIWQKNGKPEQIPGLGGSFTIPTAINDRGDVVGGAALQDGPSHVFLWTEKTGTLDLGLFPGTAFPKLTAAPCCNILNNRLQIVGFVVDISNGDSRAFLRQPTMPDLQNGTWFYLDDLLVPEGSPWKLAAAQSINDAGQITGLGFLNGEPHAFLATPCGEQSGSRGCDDPER